MDLQAIIRMAQSKAVSDKVDAAEKIVQPTNESLNHGEVCPMCGEHQATCPHLFTTESGQTVETEQKVKKVEEPVKHVLCQCGHALSDHGDEGECEIEGCECLSILTPDQVYDVNEPSFVPATEKVAVELVPTVEPDPELDENCSHLCDCGKWWSHGQSNKCRYPDLIKQGKCRACLNGVTNPDLVEERFVDGKLSQAAQVEVRTAERVAINKMSIEQITAHMNFYAMRIEELRIATFEARNRRTELEEEALKDIPQHERDKFLQDLRNGQKKEKTARKPRESKTPKKESQAGLSKQEKLIQNLMKSTGKTREQVEAYLND